MVWPFRWNLFDSIWFSISHSIKFQYIHESRLVTGSIYVSKKQSMTCLKFWSSWTFQPISDELCKISIGFSHCHAHIKGIFPFWDWKRFFTESIRSVTNRSPSKEFHISWMESLSRSLFLGKWCIWTLRMPDHPPIQSSDLLSFYLLLRMF